MNQVNLVTVMRQKENVRTCEIVKSENSRERCSYKFPFLDIKAKNKLATSQILYSGPHPEVTDQV